jgi:2-keto-3-deoxy-L-rhamnonate aldolase RhmA
MEPLRLLDAVGTLVVLPVTEATEMLSSLGFDFLFLDLEHGLITPGTLAAHAQASRVPVLARIDSSAETAVMGAADAGIDGIVAPHVCTVGQAADLVRWSTYPPGGTRGVGLTRNTLLGAALGPALTAPGPMVVAQIEDAAAVPAAGGIAAVDGVAALFVGPYDLSASLGVPGDFEQPQFTEALCTIADAAHAAGIPAGIFAPDLPTWATFRGHAYDFVVLGADTLWMATAARAALGALERGRP